MVWLFEGRFVGAKSRPLSINKRYKLLLESGLLDGLLTTTIYASFVALSIQESEMLLGLALAFAQQPLLDPIGSKTN